MDKINLQFKKIFQKSFSGFSVQHYEKTGIRPGKDWQRIASFFLVGFIVAVATALSLYFSVSDGSFWNTGSSDTSAQVYRINQNNLDKVSNYFNSKQSNMQNGPKAVPDPSL